MFSSVLSAAIWGVEAHPVRVEADISDGLPYFDMVGYVSSQVKEAKERVRTALRNTGIKLPPKRITINLAPADIRKDGAGFDLPVAASVLLAAERFSAAVVENTMIVGEMGLDGKIRGVTGVLPVVMKAKELGCHTCIVPAANRREGMVVKGIRVVAVESLEQFLDFCRHGKEPVYPAQESRTVPVSDVDFSEIRGQKALKRAVLIAAAGFHNILMVGPPGAGKTMAARRISTILPALDLEEQLEVTRIHSVAGLLPKGADILQERPFRAPHHTVSPQALAGGGRIPKPGEVTLAHRGILFIDEFPEVARRSLEILRQPLEEREITISRTYGSVRFPAVFMLVAAMNPCSCGFYPDLNRCTCTATMVSRYAGRISQPLLDRFDLCAEAPALSYSDLSGSKISSAVMREQAASAYQRQQERFKDCEIFFNSELKSRDLERFCPIDEGGKKLLERVFNTMGLGTRAYHRIIKTARTIADLEDSPVIREKHLSEAVCYRGLDKKFWRI